MKCTLCGYQFDVRERNMICSGCILATGCQLVRCPHCGYERPLTQNEKNETVLLSHMKPGETGYIINICTFKTEHLKKIVSLGLLPGMDIKLIRTFPTLLCQVGFSQFALDREIASYVVVKRENV